MRQQSCRVVKAKVEVAYNDWICKGTLFSRNPFYQRKRIVARIVSSRKREHWMQEDKMQVMSIDESTFSIRPKKFRCMFGGMVERGGLQKFIVPTFKSGYKSVSLWLGSHCVDARPQLRRSHTCRTSIDSHVFLSVTTSTTGSPHLYFCISLIFSLRFRSYLGKFNLNRLLYDQLWYLFDSRLCMPSW